MPTAPSAMGQRTARGSGASKATCGSSLPPQIHPYIWHTRSTRWSCRVQAPGRVPMLYKDRGVQPQGQRLASRHSALPPVRAQKLAPRSERGGQSQPLAATDHGAEAQACASPMRGARRSAKATAQQTRLTSRTTDVHCPSADWTRPPEQCRRERSDGATYPRLRAWAQDDVTKRGKLHRQAAPLPRQPPAAPSPRRKAIHDRRPPLRPGQGAEQHHAANI